MRQASPASGATGRACSLLPSPAGSLVTRVIRSGRFAQLFDVSNISQANGFAGSHVGSQQSPTLSNTRRQRAVIVAAHTYAGQHLAPTGDPTDLIWEQEAAGSNPAIPTRSEHMLILADAPGERLGEPPGTLPGRSGTGTLRDMVEAKRPALAETGYGRRSPHESSHASTVKGNPVPEVVLLSFPDAVYTTAVRPRSSRSVTVGMKTVHGRTRAEPPGCQFGEVRQD